MRKTPFQTAPGATGLASAGPEQSNTATPANNFHVDLTERLKQPIKKSVADQPEQQPAEEEHTRSEAQQETTAPAGGSAGSSATFEDTEEEYQEFKAGIAGKLDGSVENPEEIAEILIGLGNMGRMMFGPGFYEGLMFPGQERNDIRGVIGKSIENEKANKDATDGMNNYEKRLYSKWPVLQEAIQNISFTDDEIKRFAKLMSRHIKDMGAVKWLAKYDWLLYWAFLEMKHAKGIINGRVTEAFNKKFGV